MQIGLAQFILNRRLERYNRIIKVSNIFELKVAFFSYYAPLSQAYCSNGSLRIEKT